jgi:hypothetical protein
VEEIKVYKTTVNVSVGFSIEQVSPDGSHAWEKSSVSIATESGPGYPTAEQIAYMGSVQMRDAVDMCDQQIVELANRAIEEARKSGVTPR